MSCRVAVIASLKKSTAIIRNPLWVSCPVKGCLVIKFWFCFCSLQMGSDSDYPVKTWNYVNSAVWQRQAYLVTRSVTNREICASPGRGINSRRWSKQNYVTMHLGKVSCQQYLHSMWYYSFTNFMFSICSGILSWLKKIIRPSLFCAADQTSGTSVFSSTRAVLRTVSNLLHSVQSC